MINVDMDYLFNTLLGNDNNVYLSDNTELSTEEIYHKYHGKFVGIEITKTWQDDSCRKGIVRCYTYSGLPDGMFMKFVLDNRLFCVNADALKPIDASNDRHYVFFSDSGEVLGIGAIKERYACNFVVVDVKSRASNGEIESGIVKCSTQVFPSAKFNALLSESKNYECLELGTFNRETEEWTMDEDLITYVNDDRFLKIQDIVRCYRDMYVWVKDVELHESGACIIGGVVVCYSSVCPDSGTSYRLRSKGYKLVNVMSYEDMVDMTIYCKDNKECLTLEQILEEYDNLNVIVEPVSVNGDGTLESGIVKAYRRYEPNDEFLAYLRSTEGFIMFNTFEYKR